MILLWKDFAKLFGRAECYLILVQFCFCKENTGVALRRAILVFLDHDHEISFGPGSLHLSYMWVMGWDRCL